MWSSKCAFYYHTTIFSQAVDHGAFVITSDFDQVDNAQIMCVFY